MRKVLPAAFALIATAALCSDGVYARPLSKPQDQPASSHSAIYTYGAGLNRSTIEEEARLLARYSGCAASIQPGGAADALSVRVGEAVKSFTLPINPVGNQESKILADETRAATIWAWNECIGLPGAKEIMLSHDGSQSASHFASRTASEIRKQGCPVTTPSGAPKGRYIVTIDGAAQSFENLGEARDFAMARCKPAEGALKSTGANAPQAPKAQAALEYQAETKTFEAQCKADYVKKNHYDCACLAGEFAKKRAELGPDMPQSSIMLAISKTCPDASGAAAEKYDRCMQFPPGFASGEKTPAYCRCLADTFTELYATNSPAAGSKEAGRLETNAMMTCRAKHR
jgi:hypothetical protein